MWTINQMEQLSPFGGVSQMSHRDEPRSGRGCFGAVVVVPFLALGGMFALIALTGSPDDAPLAAPPPARPTAQWWTEPLETGVSLSTVTETVMVEGAAREVRAARLATATRVVAGTTVTETVRVGVTKPPATGRNEPEPEEPVETLPSTSDSAAPPVVTTSSVVSSPTLVPPPVVSSPGTPPVTSEPAVPPVVVPPSTPRAEDPVPTTPPPASTPTTPTTPAEPPCDRAEPVPDPSELGEPGGEISVEVGLPGASPAGGSSTSAAPLAGV
jgi:hypothetical protein